MREALAALSEVDANSRRSLVPALLKLAGQEHDQVVRARARKALESLFAPAAFLAPRSTRFRRCANATRNDEISAAPARWTNSAHDPRGRQWLHVLEDRACRKPRSGQGLSRMSNANRTCARLLKVARVGLIESLQILQTTSIRPQAGPQKGDRENVRDGTHYQQ